MRPVAPVLVAGAGPSGLVAALTLLHNNIPVRIVTKELEHRLGQRGSGIWPRTFELFHFLRVFETHERARPMLPIREYNAGSLEPRKTYVMIAYSDPTASVPYSNAGVIGQPLLESILRSHLEKYGCFVELGTELESFEDDGERVLAKLVKRKDGKEVTEVFEASYLIGADGAKGVTRKQLGLTFLGETRDERCSTLGDICIEIEGLDREHWHLIGDPTSNFLMLRPTDEVATDGFQFILATKHYEPKELIADEKLITKCISELLGRKINIRKYIALSELRPNIRMVNKFGIGRVFVSGDAAHVHSPTGGQGLNSSVQDAFNLAWKISLVYKGFSPSSLLDSYSTERLPVITEMLGLTTEKLSMFRSSSTMQNAMTREKKMNMLGINYRSSPIVLDEFTQAEPVEAYRVLEEGVLVAGDRAPDAPELALVQASGRAETVTRLFDVFSPTYHTVLVFTPDASSSTDVLEALRKYPRDVIRPVIVLSPDSEVMSGVQADVVVDRAGHAYKGYLVTEGKKVVVVRPDGVVGAMVHGVEGVAQYFANIFV